MRAKIVGHEYTYCHHSMNEGAQKLGLFIVDNDIPAEEVIELTLGMIADAAFDFRENRDVPHPLEEALDRFSKELSSFKQELREVPEKRRIKSWKREEV